MWRGSELGDREKEGNGKARMEGEGGSGTACARTRGCAARVTESLITSKGLVGPVHGVELVHLYV